ncbi:hypothetical protein [Actinosynnema mirum]|uniref:Uncharacterized protein n=1 Tax=Actinosynnema mirum (strain ATCC 29888 / DSM 43827 / JCM 3225 / NBRC 14064 / NCIMB 13271 / NRRL B-12336 / IMRU 3971 / 101) TaxID=446462 RepID=C6WC38_ACTMD|nr:hypothetical protein [Actinosynnema mirum]ACU39426.1 hypothetical protein Amir_5610 [Actinosynnema mirum DSM 43827]
MSGSHPYLDALHRQASLRGDTHAVAHAVDCWLLREHGISSGSRGGAALMVLLADEGWRVEREPVEAALDGIGEWCLSPEDREAIDRVRRMTRRWRR